MTYPTEVAQTLPVPLAVVCAPFADGCGALQQALPVRLVACGDDGPLRCPRCQCYAGPFWSYKSAKSARNGVARGAPPRTETDSSTNIVRCGMCKQVVYTPVDPSGDDRAEFT